ncbi:hypothetical protein A4D02_33860 [Niastella koreensis]|uniref:WD40 repeat-containing protein n=2 Tax=Niastella koreensis TaxID=354356 RepID=G8TBP8_NIAKG|nr:cytochrome D1 domain-containing protein [Niastella koreensis]AEV98180.1 WD40 repeat-containing protein [Niastella koreensis GR20-10]OQP45384.1 hypothetical protein A4D02_33860 [Niastella koreensis]
MKIKFILSSIYSYFFNYDIFISYTRSNGKAYARKLYEHLTSLDYTCFIDNKEAPPGGSLDGVLMSALKASKTLVLIGTEIALDRKYVQLEFKEFAKTSRPIIPININNAFTHERLESEPWKIIKERDLIWLDETASAVTNGLPSPEVYEGIQNFYAFTKRNVIRRRWVTVTSLTILITSIFAFFQTMDARAQKKVVLAQTETLKARSDSLQKSNERLIVEQKSLEAKTKEAFENAAKAKEQETLALENAEQAKKQQLLAEERIKIAEAEELAMNANAQLNEDPELSILLAREAVKVTPLPLAIAEDVLRRSLKESHVRTTLRWKKEMVLRGLFSPTGKQVLTISSDTARIWETQTGKAISRHPGTALCLNGGIFSRNGRLIATRNEQGNIDIWEAETGRTVSEIKKDFFERLTYAVFSPDGSLVATGGKETKLWNPLTGKKVLTLQTPNGNTSYLCFSPDNKYLFASYEFIDDGCIWEIASGKVITELKTDNQISGAEFSPDGKFVLTFSNPSLNVKVWNPLTGKLVSVLKGQHDWITSASFSPDSKSVIASSEDGTAKIWNISTGEVIASMLGHTAGVTDALFSHDGKLVVTTSKDGTTCLWEKAGRLITKYHGHGGPVNKAEFSPDDHSIITSSADGTSKIWEVLDEKANILLPTTGSVFNIDFSPDNRFVATADEDNKACVWEIASQKIVSEFIHKGSVKSVEYSANGKILLTTDDNRSGPSSWYIWDVQKNKLLTKGHLNPNGKLALSPDNKGVLIADTALTIIDIATGQQKMQRRISDAIKDISFSPDGKYFVTTSGTTAKLWSSSNGTLVSTLRGNTFNLNDNSYRWNIHARFSSNSRYIITSGTDNTARVWITGSEKPVMVIRGDNGILTDADFSPDNRLIATSDDDGTARIRDLLTSKILVQIKAHKNSIDRVTFSRDGRFIATSSYWDGTTGIWSTSTGSSVEKLNGLIRGKAFAPDGKFIATVGDIAKLTRCESCLTCKELLEIANRRVTRTLTADERKQYLRK